MVFLKRFFQVLLLFVFSTSILLLLTGNGYLLKGMRCTYLRGETTATIDDFQFFAQRSIQNGKHIPWSLSENYNRKPLLGSLSNSLKKYRSVAFLVIKNDSIQYEKYWDGYGKNSLSNSFSMAKSVVGMLTGFAIQDGYLSNLEEKVIDYIPELKGKHAQEVTIRDLLQMTSGLEWEEHYTSPFSVTAKAYYTRNLEPLILDQVISKPPGEIHEYKSGNTQLLAIVLQRATKKNLGTYASEKLWVPLGASQPAIWSLDKEQGVEKAYCCLASNARDFARLGQLFLDKGKWQGIQLLDASFVTESISPSVTNSGVVHHYGLSWWLIPEYNTPVFYMRGILGQYVFVFPELDIVAVRLGHQRNKNIINNHPNDVREYISGILKMYQK